MFITKFLNGTPAPAAPVAPEKVDKTYKRQRIQTFLAATIWNLDGPVPVLK